MVVSATEEVKKLDPKVEKLLQLIIEARRARGCAAPVGKEPETRGVSAGNPEVRR